jgi:hypothetical protein
VEEGTAGQAAPDAPESPAAGTAPEATDVADQPQETPEAATPDGTTDESVTASAEETPEQVAETKSRRERQREARKKSSAPVESDDDRIRRAIEAHERQKAETEATARVTRERDEKLSKWLGSDEELAELERTITEPPPSNLYEVDLEAQNARNAKVAEAIRRRQELLERRGLLDEVTSPLEQSIGLRKQEQALNWLSETLESVATSAGVDAQSMFASGLNKPLEERLPAILSKYGELLTSPLHAQIDEVTEDRDTWKSEAESLRLQLGGRALAPTRGGTLATGNGSGTVVDRLIQQAGSEDAYIERAMRGEYAGVDLTK